MGRNSWKVSVNDSVDLLNQAARRDLELLLKRLLGKGLQPEVAAQLRTLVDAAAERYQVHRFKGKQTGPAKAWLTLDYRVPDDGHDPEQLKIVLCLEPDSIRTENDSLPDWVQEHLAP